MKRTDNEKRKSEIAIPKMVNISTDEAREPCVDSHTCVEPGGSLATCREPVESITQMALKSPAEYVTMAMKAHEDRQLTVEEFMQATELSVFKLITDTFRTALYERPDLYVYVTEEMVRWQGFEGERKYQRSGFADQVLFLRSSVAMVTAYGITY